MGIGGISVWQLVIILLIVIMLFGSKRLKSLGSDVGGAIKGFKNSVSETKGIAEPEEESSHQKV